MSFNHNFQQLTNSPDYGIPVAPPHARDAEMTDSEHVNDHNASGKPKSSKSRSPGKRVVYYHSLEPEHIWPQHISKQKKGIGKYFNLQCKMSQLSNA